MTRRPRSHVRILIYLAWATAHAVWHFPVWYILIYSVSVSSGRRCMTIRQRILIYRAFFLPRMFCFVLVWPRIRHLHISHNAPHLPPKILHDLCFHFSWILQPSREKLKTTFTQNFGRHIRPALWEMCKWRIHDICQLCILFDGIKAMSRGLLGGQTSVKICQYA